MSNWDVRVDVVDLESIRDRVNAAQQTQGDVKDLVAIADEAGREIDRLRADIQAAQARVAVLEEALRRAIVYIDSGNTRDDAEMAVELGGFLSADPSPLREVVRATVTACSACTPEMGYCADCQFRKPCDAVTDLLEKHPEWKG